jgi:thiol-disulfide isomerase/thioredoxin
MKKAALTLPVILALMACGGGGEQPVPSPRGATELAPEFALNDLDGATVKLSNYKGKVVILDFWATWCAPCREEIPGFVELQRDYGDEGLVIIGVSLDSQGPSVVKRFAVDNGMNYTLVMGDEKVQADYGGIRGIPTTFVIDREGRLIKKYIGMRPKAVFEADITALL